MKTETGEWRGIVKGHAAEPETVSVATLMWYGNGNDRFMGRNQAYGYMQRSFRHLLGSVMGAMRLLEE